MPLGHACVAYPPAPCWHTPPFAHTLSLPTTHTQSHPIRCRAEPFHHSPQHAEAHGADLCEECEEAIANTMDAAKVRRRAMLCCLLRTARARACTIPCHNPGLRGTHRAKRANIPLKSHIPFDAVPRHDVLAGFNDTVAAHAGTPCS